MDDCNDKNYNNGLIDSASYIIICGSNLKERNDGKGAAEQFGSHPLGNAKKLEEMSVQVSRPTSVLKKSDTLHKIQRDQATDARPIRGIPESSEPYCHVRLDALVTLKDSTKKLLCLIEEIQTKTLSKDFPPAPDSTLDEIRLIRSSDGIRSLAAPALKNLEAQTKTLNNMIRIEEEDDDCSIFKRLTRKCNCLNQLEYNDFVIHFNEDPNYFTSTTGEIIKNMRILKKFLYMGGRYTKNALTFLNENYNHLNHQNSPQNAYNWIDCLFHEKVIQSSCIHCEGCIDDINDYTSGLDDLPYTEKVEITQGCSHSDMCNVFEDNSIVCTCIAWPCKFEYYGDSTTQKLAASFLYKLAQLEEGRRYLKFTSKITNDIKKILNKKRSILDVDITDSLNAVLDILHPPMPHVNDDTYQCWQNDEGFGNETVKALAQYRQYMTLDEIFMHLDLLHNLSKEEKGKVNLASLLPSLLILFKQILKEYDNSEMNIIITNILNNIISKNMFNKKETNLPKKMVTADTATEPVKMRSEIIQMPPPPQKKSHNTKKPSNKSKSYLGGSNKFRQASRRKVPEKESQMYMNKSRKLGKSGKDRTQIIVVPIEKSKRLD